MHPKDDPINKQQDDQIDRALRDKHRALNISAEITSMQSRDPEEDQRNLIGGRLTIAEGMLVEAENDRCSYSEVVDFVTDKILKLEPGNATGLTMRAIAFSQLYRFTEAVKDAEKAISVEQEDNSQMGQRLRRELRAWRDDSERYGT